MQNEFEGTPGLDERSTKHHAWSMTVSVIVALAISAIGVILATWLMGEFLLTQ